MRSDLVNKVLDAMEIMVKADQNNSSSSPTISATIIEQDSENKTKYRIQVENQQRFATAMNGVYKKNDEVYVAYPESGEIGVIIGLKYREGANAVSLITEANYKKLTPNSVMLNPDNNEYIFNEVALQQALAPTQDGATRATTILAKFKLNADLEIKESIFYQVVFKIKFIEEDKAREFAFTIDDVHGNPYIQKSSEQFFEIKLPDPKELTYSNFESIAIEGNITISNVEIYAAQKLDETGIPSARIYAVNGSTFGEESWQTPFNVPITLKAEMRDEGLIRELSETSCYWFKEDPLITKADDLGYHSWGGLGWRLLNQTSNGEVNLMSNTLNVSSNTIFRSSVKYKCTIVYNNNHYDADPIEIINTNASLPKLTFYYSEHTTESFLRASVTGTIPAGADVYFRVTAKDAFGKNIENFSKSKLLNAWGPIDRTAINGFNTYTCDLILDFQEGFDEYVETQSTEVKELVKDFGRIAINGKKIYLYNEAGELDSDIDPLTVKVYTDNTQTVELQPSYVNAEGKTVLNYSIHWRLPDVTQSMIYGPTNSQTNQELKLSIRNIYLPQYTISNTVGVDIEYYNEQGEKTGTESTSVEIMFAQQGGIGTNGTQYICKIGMQEEGQSGAIKVTYPNLLLLNTVDPSDPIFRKIPTLVITLFRSTDGIEIDTSNTTIIKSILKLDSGATAIVEDKNIGWEGSVPYTMYGYVLKAQVLYNGIYYTTYLPVAFGGIDPNSGFYSVLYNSAGKNPKYRKNSSFKFQDGTQMPINAVYPISNKLIQIDLEKNQLIPAEQLTSGQETMIVVDNGNGSFPILFYFNRYENAAINSWDGDKVEINNDGNYILAAQGGFGKKDNGSFTGVVLGTRQVNKKVENGIFGYKNGLETFLLNAETGDAKFKGKVEATEGRIGDVDNSNGAYWQITKDYINSGDLYLIGAKGWSARNSSPIGQMLGKDTNEITKAVEDVCIRSQIAKDATFAITRSGAIYATSGCVAGWKFNWDKENLFNNGLYYETKDGKGIGLWPYGNGKNKDLVIHAGSSVAGMDNAPFRLTKDGMLYAHNVEIKGRIFGSSFESTDFKIDSLGNMEVKKGKIGFWTLSENLLASSCLIFRSSTEKPVIEVNSGTTNFSFHQEVESSLTKGPDSISINITEGQYYDQESQDGQYLDSVILQLINQDFDEPIYEQNVTSYIQNEEEDLFNWDDFSITISHDPFQSIIYDKARLVFNIIKNNQTVLSISPEGEIKNQQLTDLNDFYKKIDNFGYTFGQASFYQKYRNNKVDNYSGLGISNVNQSPCFFAAAEFQNGSDGKFKVEWNGDLWAYRINGQELNMLSATETDSDIRLKNSINSLSNNYEVLFDSLQPVSYKYNNGTSNRIHIGFIAQPTLEAVINAGFTQDEFAPLCLVDKGKENEHWAIRYEEFIALNTDQIQKAKARIATLETENLYLKARLGQLEEKVNQLIGY